MGTYFRRWLKQGKGIAVEVFKDGLDAVSLFCRGIEKLDTASEQYSVCFTTIVGIEDPGGSAANAFEKCFRSLFAVQGRIWFRQGNFRRLLALWCDSQPA